MKRFCLMNVVVFFLLISCPLAKADEVSNTFVGTVNGEDVIAYLDHSSVTYFSGSVDDFDASFVCFDSYGQPKYCLNVRINDSTSQRTYSPGNGKKIDYFSARMVYEPQDTEFKDYYRIVEGATNWKVTFTQIDRKNGVIKGTVKATLLPSRYNKSPYPLQDSVKVEGSFELQLKTIHPVMHEYRSKNPAYAQRYETYYAHTIGAYSNPTSDNDDSLPSIINRCFSCSGNGRCSSCGGDGKLNSVTSTLLTNYYRTCSGTGKCPWCGGDGIR